MIHGDIDVGIAKKNTGFLVYSIGGTVVPMIGAFLAFSTGPYNSNTMHEYD